MGWFLQKQVFLSAAITPIGFEVAQFFQQVAACDFELVYLLLLADKDFIQLVERFFLISEPGFQFVEACRGVSSIFSQWNYLPVGDKVGALFYHGLPLKNWFLGLAIDAASRNTLRCNQDG